MSVARSALSFAVHVMKNRLRLGPSSLGAGRRHHLAINYAFCISAQQLDGLTAGGIECSRNQSPPLNTFGALNIPSTN